MTIESDIGINVHRVFGITWTVRHRPFASVDSGVPGFVGDFFGLNGWVETVGDDHIEDELVVLELGASVDLEWWYQEFALDCYGFVEWWGGQQELAAEMRSYSA